MPGATKIFASVFEDVDGRLLPPLVEAKARPAIGKRKTLRSVVLMAVVIIFVLALKIATG